MNDEKNTVTILIAEDDEDIRQLVSLYIQNEGWTPLLAKDGELPNDKIIFYDRCASPERFISIWPCSTS